MRRLILALSMLSFAATAAHPAEKSEESSQQARWYRCNTHAHTGDGPNDMITTSALGVARWFKDHGYQCLVITDHEHITEVSRLNKILGNDFLVIQGEEITQRVQDDGHPGGIRHAHVNGIGVNKLVLPMGSANTLAKGVSVGETFQSNIPAISAAGGIAQVNHPNAYWSVDVKDLAPMHQSFLLEIWNAAATNNNLGGMDSTGVVRLSTEGMWDALLSQGKTVWAVASDDSHDYHNFDDPYALTPGKSWIVVRANALTQTAIMDAIRAGDFYASNGVPIDDVVVDAKGITIKIGRPAEPAVTTAADYKYRIVSNLGGPVYTTRFIGRGGKLLAEVAGFSPRYTFKGDEQYVRASIIDSDGRRAWTQPVFRDGRKPAW